ncbi:MAG: NAD-dependent epimerase/dehydratase family protein [Streptosporangiales bacterium]|nr:NAD-dependent epimerase/dehydratase family protein [Streptosporangiales bacterium]
MRVVIVGATGNVGTSLIRNLLDDDRVTSILGMARRRPAWRPDRTEWVTADITTDDITPHLHSADAVVHLGWLFQPTHDPVATWRTNVMGGIRVFRCAADAEVPVLVYASSVGAYSPGPRGRRVAEDWPAHGWPAAAYTREKAYLERYLDGFEAEHPGMRVVRLRPAFSFKREAASEQRRLFAGPLLPNRLVDSALIPVLPGPADLTFQAVHTDDVAEAYRQALLRDVRGAFNIAAEPPLDLAQLAGLLGARPVRTPSGPLRGLLAAAWRMHLVPAAPELFDAVLRLPLMDTGRARQELGWSPRHDALDAVREFLDGLRDGAGMDTPPLSAATGGRGRVREFATGVGRRP